MDAGEFDAEFGPTPLAAAAAATASASAAASASALPAAAAAGAAAAAASGAASPAPSPLPPAPSPYALVRFLQGVPQLVWVVLIGGAYYLSNLYFNQDAILYHPTAPGLPFRRPSENPPPYHSPAAFGLAFEDVALVARDGVRLHAWFVRAPAAAPAPAPTLVFFHANAGNIGFRLPLAKALVEGLGCNFLMLEYRGYGNSEGAPGEEGIALDADAAMDWVAARAAASAAAPDGGGAGAVDARAVFLFGQSLGGAVAVRCAATRAPGEVAGVILENTFTSIADMVDRLMPLVAPLKRWLLRIRWASVDLIGRVEAPFLFVGGQKDELVAPEMMRRLHAAAARAAFRVFFAVEDGTHNDTFLKGGTRWLAHVKDFIARAMRRRGLEWRAAPAAAEEEGGARPPRRGKLLERGAFDAAAAPAPPPPAPAPVDLTAEPEEGPRRRRGEEM